MKLRLFVNIAIILFISSFLFLHKTNKIEIIVLTQDKTTLLYQYSLANRSFLPFFIQNKSFALKQNEETKSINNKELLFFLAKNNFSTPKSNYILTKHRLLIVLNLTLLALSILYLIISLVKKLKKTKVKLKHQGYLKRY